MPSFRVKLKKKVEELKEKLKHNRSTLNEFQGGVGDDDNGVTDPSSNELVAESTGDGDDNETGAYYL
jgi:hypothetical protein